MNQNIIESCNGIIFLIVVIQMEQNRTEQSRIEYNTIQYDRKE